MFVGGGWNCLHVYTVDDFVLGLLTLEFYTHSVLMKKLNPTMHRISYCVDEVTVTSNMSYYSQMNSLDRRSCQPNTLLASKVFQILKTY
jgi:hypothetical protein